MSMQADIGVGSVFKGVIRQGDQEFAQGRVPRLGTKVRFQDGREFVFCSSIVSHAAGVLKGMAATSGEISGTTGAVGAIGATSITLMTGTLAANLYQDGYVLFTDDTGEGYTYRIKSHTAGTTTVGAVFQLYDPLIVAIDATTDYVLVQHPCANTIANTATTIPVGVTLGAFTYSSATGPGYFWVQTKGPCTIQGSGTLVTGQPADAGAAGVVSPKSAYTTNTVGIVIVGADNGQIPVWLNLNNV